MEAHFIKVVLFLLLALAWAHQPGRYTPVPNSVLSSFADSQGGTLNKCYHSMINQGGYLGNVICLKNIPSNIWLSKRSWRRIWLQKCPTSREEAPLWSPGFAGSSSIPHHLIDLLVGNPTPGPKAAELEEHGWGLELVNAELLCRAAQGRANMPWGSVTRSGSFGMRRPVCWAWPLVAAPLSGHSAQLATISLSSVHARPALGFRGVNSFAAISFRFCYHVKIKHLSK